MVKRALGIDLILEKLILLGILLGILDHALDFIFRQTALIICDGNALRFACASLFGDDREDAVGINGKGNLDLGYSSRSRRDPVKVELAKEMVILSEGALTFIDGDFDGGLLVRSCGV
jgi:hypothetical protein